MIKPVWAAVAGLALLGTAGGVGLLIASPGGEKEAAVQNQQTASVASTATPDSAPSPTSAITPSPTASAPTPGPSGTLWRWGKVTVRIPAASDVRVSHESVLADLKPPNGGLAISLTRDVPLGGPSSSLLIDADTGAVLVYQVRDEDRAAIDEVFKTLAVSPLDVAIAPWPYNGDPPPELEKRREGKIGYLVPAPQTGIFVAPGISDFCASPECAELD